VERWHRRPLPDIGGRADEIREAEVRLGRRLPPSAREWVAFAGDIDRNFRDAYQMEELEGHSAVSLLLQGEGDYHWAVRHEDFTLPDPPVYGFLLDYDSGDEGTFVPEDRNPVAPAVTVFAFDYMMAYTYGAGGGFSTDVADSAGLLRDLQAAFPVHARFGEIDLFESENILVQLGPSVYSPDTRIDVKVAKPLPREAVPALLWDYTRHGGGFHGMFVPDHLRGDEGV
jgi:hypothetical protein